MHKAENVINEEQHVQVLLVTEVFGHCHTRQADAQASSGRLGHLPVNQCSARLLRIPRNHHSGLLEFQPQFVSFARPLAHAPNHRHAPGLHGDCADGPRDQVLLHFRGHVQRLRQIESVAGNAHGVVNRRQMPLLKLYVEYRPDDLDHSSHLLLRHLCSYAVYEAPLTISMISFVIAACLTLFMCSVRPSITSPAFFVAASIAVMRAACSAAQDSSMLRNTCVSTYRGSKRSSNCCSGCS